MADAYYRDNAGGRRQRAREHAAGMAPDRVDAPRAPRARPAPISGDAHIAGFGAQYPAEAAWLATNVARSAFADSLVRRIRSGLLLSPAQLDALQRCAAPKPEAAAADVSAIEQAFASAREKGIKTPRMRLADFKLTSGKPGSAHAGAVFVREGDNYLGKVLGGKFLPTGMCSNEKRDAVLAAIADPKAAAVAFGQRTGNCAVCGLPLVKTESVDRGVGPICMEKMGW